MRVVLSFVQGVSFSFFFFLFSTAPCTFFYFFLSARAVAGPAAIRYACCRHFFRFLSSVLPRHCFTFFFWCCFCFSAASRPAGRLPTRSPRDAHRRHVATGRVGSDHPLRSVFTRRVSTWTVILLAKCRRLTGWCPLCVGLLSISFPLSSGPRLLVEVPLSLGACGKRRLQPLRSSWGCGHGWHSWSGPLGQST